MNDFDLLKKEKRNQTLVVVEGEHEKHTLLNIMLTCFPEIPIMSENIHVYAADIYDLYHDIEKEYESNWYEGDLAIDIPMLISRRYNLEPQLNKNNFTNIILMFDYEHHDIWFSDEKIQRMQRHFDNISNDGILYINYPMIEAYKDIDSIPDETYLQKFVSVKCQPGKKYKQKVDRYSGISKYFNVYDSLLKYLNKELGGLERKELVSVINDIFSIREEVNLKANISSLLNRFDVEEKVRINLEYSIAAAIKNLEYLDEGMNYWEKLREIFIYIVGINIEKGIAIQNGFEISEDSIKEMYSNLDWTKILEEQNRVSSDECTGIIWVLCTCITLLAEYKVYWNESNANQ